MNMMPTVVEATYRGEYLIDLRFSDGSQGTVDFSAWLVRPVVAMHRFSSRSPKRTKRTKRSTICD